jgi:squalene cyclase
MTSSRAATECKVTPEIERAVTKGLEYLARTQQPDGSWASDNYGRTSGVVGLALLTFLAHGEQPDEGRYSPVVRRGVDYILKSQQPNGLLSGDGSSPMYSHGFATLALGEVYGMLDDPRIGPALEKAAGLLVSSQNALGGWRYSVGSPDADTTVSGAQMIGLRAAASAGIEVPITTIQRGVKFYMDCFCPGGGFGYTGPGGPNLPRAGIGLLVLSLSGAYRSPQAKATADFMLGGGAGSEGYSGYFYYMCYYGSQAMYQAGGKYWQHWNQTMTPALLSMQQPDGSWPAGGAGGVICNTAFALLALEVNYNLLPIYQR